MQNLRANSASEIKEVSVLDEEDSTQVSLADEASSTNQLEEEKIDQPKRHTLGPRVVSQPVDFPRLPPDLNFFFNGDDSADDIDEWEIGEEFDQGGTGINRVTLD